MEKPEECKLYKCLVKNQSGEQSTAFLRWFNGFWYYINYQHEMCIFKDIVVDFRLHDKDNIPVDVEINFLNELLKLHNY